MMNRFSLLIQSKMTLIHSCLHKQHTVDTSIELRVIGDLRHLTPSDLTRGSDQSQITHIHLNNGTLGHNSQVGVKITTGILLDTQNIELKTSLELRVCDISLLHPQPCWSNKSLKFGSLTGKAIPHKGTFGNDALPRFISLLSRPHNLEHFIIRHRLHLGNGHIPLPRLLLPLLLNGITQHFGATHTLTVEEVSRHSTVGHSLVIRMLVIPLIVLRDGFTHGGFFFESAFIVEFGTESEDLLGEFGSFVGEACFAFA
mmetsp:Transcript_22305/g.32606  ORF Transcript_22305/g.32606 Transcript_22305/m.32606 type:complete len:257 (+) Transcript_22305:14-784(+)